MESKTTNSPIFLHKGYCKDKILALNIIISTVEKGTGKSINQLQMEYTQDRLFYLTLRHVSTTKKAVCEAMGIPVEAGCRYKRKLEKSGYLVQSVDLFVCPFTNHFAHILSTNPDEFDRLRKPRFIQLKLF